MTKKKIVTPLTYYGGKQKLAKVLIPLIPPHKTYVKPFVGGGAIFWLKPVTEISNKRNSFSGEYAIRLQNVQIEKTDALRIINSRDHISAFHYCDPLYYNADCGHYDGYSKEDYTSLLQCLPQIRGKFLLSSYPSPELKQYIKNQGWYTLQIQSSVMVDNTHGKPHKKKIGVLTANYDLNAIQETLTF